MLKNLILYKKTFYFLWPQGLEPATLGLSSKRYKPRVAGSSPWGHKKIKKIFLIILIFSTFKKTIRKDKKFDLISKYLKIAFEIKFSFHVPCRGNCSWAFHSERNMERKWNFKSNFEVFRDEIKFFVFSNCFLKCWKI